MYCKNKLRICCLFYVEYIYICHMNKALLDILKVGGLFWYMVVLFSDKIIY